MKARTMRYSSSTAGAGSSSTAAAGSRRRRCVPDVGGRARVHFVRTYGDAAVCTQAAVVPDTVPRKDVKAAPTTPINRLLSVKRFDKLHTEMRSRTKVITRRPDMPMGADLRRRVLYWWLAPGRINQYYIHHSRTAWANKANSTRDMRVSDRARVHRVKQHRGECVTPRPWTCAGRPRDH